MGTNSNRRLAPRREILDTYCGGGSPMKAYRWEKRGLLPQPVHLAGRAYYYVDEVEERLAEIRKGQTQEVA